MKDSPGRKSAIISAATLRCQLPQADLRRVQLLSQLGESKLGIVSDLLIRGGGGRVQVLNVGLECGPAVAHRRSDKRVLQQLKLARAIRRRCRAPRSASQRLEPGDGEIDLGHHVADLQIVCELRL